MGEAHSIKLGGRWIDFRLRRTDRRTLAITVHPDLSVVVTAPRQAAIEGVLAKVQKRALWINQQRRYFCDFLPQAPPRRYVSGETHRYLGRQYRLKVVEAIPCGVKMSGGYILVFAPCKNDAPQVRKLVETWFRKRAEERFTHSFAEGIRRVGPRLAAVPKMHLRSMSKRWGSWTRLGGVWLNPELVKAPGSCIDYVVTHELCHAVHGNHGKEFYRLLRLVMPDWEQRKARLERMTNG
jgi:predicted metal-dependent hydrolase